MWKKLLVMVAVVGLIFTAVPAMAQANGIHIFSWNHAYAKVHMYQLGAAGNAFLATPNFVVMANGTAGVQHMSMKTGTVGNGFAAACALQAQGSSASQTLTGNGFTLTQRAAGFQVQSAHAVSYSRGYSYRSGPSNGPT